MNLQEIFYLTAIVYLTVTGIAAIYVFYQIKKMISFIKEKKQDGQEMLMNAVKTKYAVQMAIFRFFYKLLGGGGRYE